jgi:hypothetical protein
MIATKISRLRLFKSLTLLNGERQGRHRAKESPSSLALLLVELSGAPAAQAGASLPRTRADGETGGSLTGTLFVECISYVIEHVVSERHGRVPNARLEAVHPDLTMVSEIE